MDGLQVGMKFETRKAMQARYKRERGIRDNLTCPRCGGEAFPGGGCERDCDDE